MMQQTGVGRGAEPRARALLIYTDRGLEREVALQRTPFTIGRLPDRDLVLDAPYVSRQHAEIQAQGEGFALVDLASKGGCFVNGGRVDRHVLCDDDAIQIGSLEGPQIRFMSSGHTPSMPLKTLFGQIQESGREHGRESVPIPDARSPRWGGWGGFWRLLDG